jgi:hypothetical protein
MMIPSEDWWVRCATSHLTARDKMKWKKKKKFSTVW